VLEAFRQLEYPMSPERPSATFVEDAYRHAVTTTLGELTEEDA
jgi:hypothetical protein